MKSLALEIASGWSLRWAQDRVCTFHYRHCLPNRKTRPMVYVVRIDDTSVGCLFFGRPQTTRCYEGELTFGSISDVQSGRARFDRWEVLNLSRVWFSEHVQVGGMLCDEDHVPGFRDRRGVWRSALASKVIELALQRVNSDYLALHPPVYPHQPYAIRAVMSYCDSTRHKGTIYKAAGFHVARTNDAGMQTWYTEAVKPLSRPQDEEIRYASARDIRAALIRARTGAPEPFLPFVPL